MKELIKMFLVFFKIGAFTFGGGYAMIPLIEKEIVDKNKWVDKDEFVDIVVLSQSFPGVLAVNCSTMVGYKVRGFIGAVATTLGTVLPSLLIILCIAMYFMKFRTNPIVNSAFMGISAAVPILVLVAITSIGKSMEKTKLNYIIIIIALLLLIVLDINPIFIIISCATFGYFYYGRASK